MNCREAKLRLSGSHRNSSPVEADKELLLHLNECTSCASEAIVSDALKKVLESSESDDTGEIIPMELMRRRVESSTHSRSKTQQKAKFNLRPALKLSLLVSAAAVLAMMWIPFSYQQTIGYEVSLAGVNQNLVNGNDRLCGILEDMELFEAAVDVLGCDNTCDVLVFDLKSHREAQMVVSAVMDLNNYDLKTDIIPVQTSQSENLFNRVKKRLSNKYGDL